MPSRTSLATGNRPSRSDLPWQDEWHDTWHARISEGKSLSTPDSGRQKKGARSTTWPLCLNTAGAAYWQGTVISISSLPGPRAVNDAVTSTEPLANTCDG